MKQKIFASVLVVGILCFFGMVANAGWTITSSSSAPYTTPWEVVTTGYNDSDQYDSYAYSYSDSRTVSISAEVGLDNVVSAKIGFSAGQTITDSYTYTATLPPQSYRDILARWEYRYYYGKAKYEDFFVTRENVTWTADVPKHIELKGGTTYYQ